MTDTTQPASSAASIEVVPAENCALNAESVRIELRSGVFWPPLGFRVSGAGRTVQRSSSPAKGLVPSW